jgi:two-component system, OmpR family, response regulator
MQTILVIDDHESTLLLTRTALRRWPGKWHVQVATNGLSGLEQVERYRDQISLVLLDIFLPGMDGREVYRRIKALAPDLLVILTSADDDVLKELKAGGSRTIRNWKPPG